MPPAPSPLSRRRFLAHSALAAAGAAAAGALAPAVPAAETSRKKMRFGLTTYQWGQDWDIPALIANCTRAGVFGVELRTSLKYAHGVELEIDAQRRREVKKTFADSPVTLVGLATSERYDAVDPAQVAAAVEKSKAYLQLSQDIGASGIRVFPNDFHKQVPREKTIRQIARALNAVGAFAAQCGQQVRFEAHGSAGELPTMRAIMDLVDQPSVRVKLNSASRDAQGQGFEYQFNLVKDFLGDTVHLHDMRDADFPNRLQIALLHKMGWSGWMLLEATHKVPDRVRALEEQREIWDEMLAQCEAAKG